MIVSVAGAALLSIGFAGVSGQENAMSATTVSAKAAKNKVVGVNSAVYKKVGKKAVKTSAIVRAGSRVTTYGKKTIKGVTYYEIGKGQYIKAANVDGKVRKLAKSTSLYTRNGKAIKGSKLAKGKKVRIFGKAITIHGKKFYAIKRGYIPAKALAVKQAPVDDITPTNPATPTAPTAPSANTSAQTPSSTTNIINGGSGSNYIPAPGESLNDAKNAAKSQNQKIMEFAKAAARKGRTTAELNKINERLQQLESAINDATTLEEVRQKQTEYDQAIVNAVGSKNLKSAANHSVKAAYKQAVTHLDPIDPIDQINLGHILDNALGKGQDDGTRIGGSIANSNTISKIIDAQDKAIYEINSLIPKKPVMTN